MIKVMMFDTEARRVIFKGAFDKVQFANKQTAHPLYPERTFQDVQNGPIITEAGEYLALFTKYDSTPVEEPPSYGDDDGEEYDSNSSQTSNSFLYPFGE